MRQNLPITNKNCDYSDAIRIVSTTTKKGVITHANTDFETVSGFTQDELIGQAHNLVRHPDMPQAAFKDLWDTVARDEPWMGIVKNRCKNGDHYWVDAFVMPYRGETADEDGLQSVRFKPSAELVSRAERVYQNINQQKSPFLAWSPKHWSLFAKAASSVSLALLPMLVVLVLGLQSTVALFTGLVLGGTLALAWSFMFTRPYVEAAHRAQATDANNLGQYIYTGRLDELGSLELANKFLTNRLETALWRVASSAEGVEKEAEESADVSSNTLSQVETQTLELEQLATAMNEMVASISEVSRSSVDVSGAVDNVKNMVQQGSDEVGRTKECIDGLVEGMRGASDKVQKISESSVSISDLVNAIHSIAEQTNLLALNAAIEAARAGEQGRGFAVVADEVRNLANNTADTTSQIQQAIEKIREDVETAVELMSNAEDQSRQTIEQSENAYALLQSINAKAEETTEAVIQIATATEEQSAVSDEINQNVHRIQESGEVTRNNMSEVQKANDRLHSEVKSLRVVAADFTTSN